MDTIQTERKKLILWQNGIIRLFQITKNLSPELSSSVIHILISTRWKFLALPSLFARCRYVLRPQKHAPVETKFSYCSEKIEGKMREGGI